MIRTRVLLTHPGALAFGTLQVRQGWSLRFVAKKLVDTVGSFQFLNGKIAGDIPELITSHILNLLITEY